MWRATRPWIWSEFWQEKVEDRWRYEKNGGQQKSHSFYPFNCFCSPHQIPPYFIWMLGRTWFERNGSAAARLGWPFVSNKQIILLTVPFDAGLLGSNSPCVQRGLWYSQENMHSFEALMLFWFWNLVKWPLALQLAYAKHRASFLLASLFFQYVWNSKEIPCWVLS